MIDLTTASRRLADVVGNVTDEQLDAPTPCPDYTLGDLLDHVAGLALAFTEAAEKSFDPAAAGPPPPGTAADLDPDWRTTIPARLLALAEAWKDPEAWTGMTRAGGIDLPGEIGGQVALDEVVVHGWDVARASGQPFSPSEEELEVVLAFLSSFPDEARGEAFGPPTPVAPDAPLLDRVVAASGRDPAWAPG